MPSQVDLEMEVSSFTLCHILHKVPHQHKGNIFQVTFSENSILFLFFCHFLLLFTFFFLEYMFWVLIPSLCMFFLNSTIWKLD